MPNIKDQSTVDAIARAFVDNGRIKSLALKTAGYTKRYAETVGLQIYDNIRVKTAIQRLDEQNQEKVEHNYTTAVNMLRQRLSYLDSKAKSGNIQALRAQTDIIRELNSISGLRHQVDSGQQLIINVSDTRKRISSTQPHRGGNSEQAEGNTAKREKIDSAEREDGSRGY